MKSVDPNFARAAIEIAGELMPEGFNVSPDAPTTLESLTESFLRDGRLTVTDWHGPESIFECPIAQVSFQAWHDWNHATLQASFDPVGERRVHHAQLAQLVGWYQRNKDSVSRHSFNRMAEILFSHNVGRLDYWTVAGHAPENFRLFTMGLLFARGVLL